MLSAFIKANAGGHTHVWSFPPPYAPWLSIYYELGPSIGDADITLIVDLTDQPAGTRLQKTLVVDFYQPLTNRYVTSDRMEIDLLVVPGPDTTAPALTLTAPLARETWTGLREIRWSTYDAHPWRVLIEVSPDDGATWTPLTRWTRRQDLHGASLGCYAWNTAAHPPGSSYRVRLTPTDKAGNVGDPVVSESFILAP